MRVFLVFLCSLLLFKCLSAQDFEFGSMDAQELDMEKNRMDSISDAVVLKEYGQAMFSFDDVRGNLHISFRHHVRIKIFNKDGAGKANIVIPAYKNGDEQELVSNIQAVTYNWVDGRRQETVLDRKQIYSEGYSKYVDLTKFTMPNIQDGSIIEYSYSILSPRIYNFRTWEFQADIPKLYSEFEAIIPGTYNYNVVLRGPYKLSDQKSSILKEGFRLPGWPIDCSKMTYIMKDLPAFIEEDYMTAAANFRSAMYFELSDVYLRNGSRKSFTKEWKNVDRELLTDKSLGGQLKRQDVFKDMMPALLKGATDELQKAKLVYGYIQEQVKWNNYYGIFGEGDIKKTMERRSGNIADINLALIAALSAAHLDVEALILSTRPNGVVNKLNPVISEFNYLIAKVNIQGESYLLDASDPLLPFGMLPIRCLNGEGRVLAQKKPSYWYDVRARQKRFTQHMLTAELLPDGRLKGKISTNSIGYAAYQKRESIGAYPTIEEYVERKSDDMTGIKLSDARITGLDALESSVLEEYGMEMKLFDGLQHEQFFFNPFLVNRQSRNPFNLNDRTYPVDLGVTREEQVSIDIKLPDGFELASRPKDMKMALVDNGGRYLSEITMQDGHLRCNYILQLNKQIYGPDEYFSLKEFFSRIIQSQKADVVLKKNSL